MTRRRISVSEYAAWTVDREVIRNEFLTPLPPRSIPNTLPVTTKASHTRSPSTESEYGIQKSPVNIVPERLATAALSQAQTHNSQSSVSQEKHRKERHFKITKARSELNKAKIKLLGIYNNRVFPIPKEVLEEYRKVEWCHKEALDIPESVPVLPPPITKLDNRQQEPPRFSESVQPKHDFRIQNPEQQDRALVRKPNGRPHKRAKQGRHKKSRSSNSQLPLSPAHEATRGTLEQDFSTDQILMSRTSAHAMQGKQQNPMGIRTVQQSPDHLPPSNLQRQSPLIRQHIPGSPTPVSQAVQPPSGRFVQQSPIHSRQIDLEQSTVVQPPYLRPCPPVHQTIQSTRSRSARKSPVYPRPEGVQRQPHINQTPNGQLHTPLQPPQSAHSSARSTHELVHNIDPAGFQWQSSFGRLPCSQLNAHGWQQQPIDNRSVQQSPQQLGAIGALQQSPLVRQYVIKSPANHTGHSLTENTSLFPSPTAMQRQPSSVRPPVVDPSRSFELSGQQPVPRSNSVTRIFQDDTSAEPRSLEQIWSEISHAQHPSWMHSRLSDEKWLQMMQGEHFETFNRYH